MELYYSGVRTLVNSAADMAARAQAIRRHNYAMRGVAVPPHAIPPAPRITSVQGGHLLWQGSASAVDYSVQRSTRAGGPWTTVCNRCANDVSNGYAPATAEWYRVVAYNLDGKPSRPSTPVRA